MQNDSYLMLVSIGPVQGFIAAARRSRDLWFGSWLLSELAKAAAHQLAAQYGIAQLVFPAPETVDDLEPVSKLNVANKIVARIQGDPAEIGRAVEQAVRQRLTEIRNDAFKRISGEFDLQTATAQVDDLVEFLWVAHPLDGGNDDKRVRDRLEALMAARKATRDFRPGAGRSSQPKSSLDGLRESVIPEHAYPARREPEAVRKHKAAALYSHYKAGPAERLSGVDLLKRHGYGGDESFFPSTSHVATLPLITRLKQQKADMSGAWAQYLATLKTLEAFEVEEVPARFANDLTGRRDGSLLFPDRLAESLEGDDLRVAQQALATFLETATGGLHPQPYYAILVADGDGMGKMIDAQPTLAQHRELSRALDGFARQVPNIIEREHRGALVYAGGDDVLAFLPLHTALPCARALADTFKKALSNFHYDDGQDAKHPPTLSVGLAVSHHIEPLSDALALARSAEKWAKQLSGKNALAVTVSKRSGAERRVRGRWGTLDARLDYFITLHRTDAIPDGAAYEWREVARSLHHPKPPAGGDDSAYKTAQEALRREVRRVLRRKRAEHGTTPLANRTLDDLDRMILDPTVDIDRLADELIIARLFADAADIAGLPLKEATPV